ncbi:MAG TPA: hypothetical protein PLN22_02965, partial [Ignavibacteria bacterium]|nr:hypothetical protein [Ignavibacteria bacterium]
MNSLITLINSLDDNSIKKFGHYLNSPFFNNRDDIIRFYNYISGKIPLAELNRREIYVSVYMGSKYNEQVIVNLFS